ncbi:BQ5605_C005g03463 [Microbotryum silenes-dioicae]|uniref:BQ5605_C005g03463 protein n=1 Tax=Microbotryum silenes-dioicae TaxID=796604 RepID=A0A2X0P6G5_9BASI|nr:BQ5605_C005g03463 [Microbotryum silenes-dioicae]
MRSFLLFLASLSPLTPLVLAWGAVGHETIATIAQIHLHDGAREAVKALLPGLGHLGPIASWPDRIRGLPQYRWSGELHYTSPLGDYPPSTCHFGDEGWKTEHDVLHAIANYTQRLADDHLDVEALKFLVHFVGDVHQPLHLTDRDRGGNSDNVIFEGRRMNLHSLWDGALITKAVREQHNYTQPLPAAQIEQSLRHTIYDPYIRLILWEGVRIWWRDALPSWFLCPKSASPLETQQRRNQIHLETPSSSSPPGIFALGVCPRTWAKETHQTTCARTFPPDYDSQHPIPRELNTKEYYGPIRESNIIEKLLAQGGLRLAATLNAIFADANIQATSSPVNLSWLEDVEAQV